MKRTEKHIIIITLILVLVISLASCALFDIGSIIETTKPTTTKPITDSTTTKPADTTPTHTCEFGEWIVESEPTHAEKGSRYQLCECGAKNTEEIPVVAHEFGEWTVRREPTHSRDGYDVRRCECGASELRYTTLDHSVELVETTKSTLPCVGDTEEWYCYECCETFYKQLEPSGEHTPWYTGPSEVVSEATCQEYGVTMYICYACGARVQVTGTVLADCVLGDWVCDNDNRLVKATCSECGKIKTIPFAEGITYVPSEYGTYRVLELPRDMTEFAIPHTYNGQPVAIPTYLEIGYDVVFFDEATVFIQQK